MRFKKLLDQDLSKLGGNNPQLNKPELFYKTKPALRSVEVTENLQLQNLDEAVRHLITFHVQENKIITENLALSKLKKITKKEDRWSCIIAFQNLWEVYQDQNTAEFKIAFFNILVLLNVFDDHELLKEFSETTLDQPHLAQYLNVALETIIEEFNEIHENEKNNEKSAASFATLKGTAMLTLSELSARLWESNHQNLPKDPVFHKQRDDFTKKVGAYFLSLGNLNSLKQRSFLVHHFTRLAIWHEPHRAALEKLLDRFGHTVIDQIFESIFNNEKNSKIYFSYFMEHFDEFATSWPNLIQTVQDALKDNLLRKPDTFIPLFSKLSQHVHASASESSSQKWDQITCFLAKYTGHLGNLKWFRPMLSLLVMNLDKNNVRTFIEEMKTDQFLKKPARRLVQDAFSSANLPSEEAIKRIKRGNMGVNPMSVKGRRSKLLVIKNARPDEVMWHFMKEL